MSVIVFLGPSLPVNEAKQLLRADYRPPARQGDVFRALEDTPSAIVLIDGVFEAQPSVWHHELVAAHESGVALFGACSMGALRAAELPGVVTPLGRIADRFVSGEWNDDAAVALLHGDAAQKFRALSVPWVNVWATAQASKASLGAKEAQRLCDVAASMFYQSRTWPRLYEAMKWSAAQREKVKRVDLKADDARSALSTVAKLKFPRRAPRPSSFSSFVRRSRLAAHGLEGAEWKEGVKTLLLAEFARMGGIEPEAQTVAKYRKSLKGRFSADQLETWAHALALEALILEAPELFVSDGPSSLEGAALLRARRRSL
ncbi:MAG: hypothetical protein DI536_23635 [Archangium gephyra]|uniref:TfuA-like core domain-containing protein n=1 Tax=Archangium gephyra TaxID=48 RepID=A0A2W5TBZ2_9BACT|nr:MAG: hypothetical protein DI536_23635 [Archangium gephyra]